MNQTSINPETGLVFRPVGRKCKVGNWRFVDSRLELVDQRRVYHYDTLMGVFVKYHIECVWDDRCDDEPVGPWHFIPMSVGHRSVSDQKGMNRILAGTGWSFRRNGGHARYEYGGRECFPGNGA